MFHFFWKVTSPVPLAIIQQTEMQPVWLFLTGRCSAGQALHTLNFCLSCHCYISARRLHSLDGGLLGIPLAKEAWLVGTTERAFSMHPAPRLWNSLCRWAYFGLAFVILSEAFLD